MAVVVEGAFERSNSDRAMEEARKKERKRKFSRDIEKFFDLLDENGDGVVQTETLAQYVRLKHNTAPGDLGNLVRLFLEEIMQILDSDGSKSFSFQQFRDRVLSMYLDDSVPTETKLLLELVKSL